ncbi:MAG: single-stranded-DNA-specific exonuclease RecJ [Clostridiaceae bacterium]|nr:single-stranded-DNA-specific exonuclease RecJ [Clostridiaceae bacterium]
MEKLWMLKQTTTNLKEIARKCFISETLALILANRGIKEEKEINKFLKASIEDLYDPFLMKDMKKGVDLIIEAINGGKKIVVYGDYDADGVTSTTILYRAIKLCKASVSYHIPDRESEGYGMSTSRIKLLKEQGTDLIISCDNGISAIEQVKVAKELGISVIITDHHELSFITDENEERNYIIPEADAVINPKQLDCKYPFKLLCGAGIAFKFVQALFSKLGMQSEKALDFIELAGIGTICDIVDLVDENRIIVKNALVRLSNTENLGIIALKKVLGINDKAVNTYNIGYQIGPCINATGRLDKASLSVELLLCEDEQSANELAKRLNELNKERQEMTSNSVDEVIQIVESLNLNKQKVLVIYKEDLHESIAGIVAGKIKERYNLPTILLTSGKEMPKGSGRSIEEYNMFEELLKCKDVIAKFGGHPMAAGLSISEENINILRQKLNENCTLTEEDFKPKIRIEKRLPLKTVNLKFIEELQVLEPFGKGNPSPLFAEKNISIQGVSYLGKDSSTLKLFMDLGDGKTKAEGICFGRGDDFKELLNNANPNVSDNLRVDLIFTPQINEYLGNRKLQFKISDFRLST